MAKVLFLQHVMRYENDENAKSVGFYSSWRSINEALSRASKRPGFSDSRGVFRVLECDVGRSVWPSVLDAPGRSISEPAPGQSRTAKLYKGNHIYLLFNMNEVNSSDFEAMLGVYSSRAAAEEEIRQHQNAPELNAAGRKFGVAEYRIDEDNWVHGFSVGE